MIKNSLTLIVAVYNLGNKLVPCLKSLQSITSRQIKIIIIDDGSDIETKKILYDFQKLLPTCEIKTQENSGIVSVRKLGLLLCNTEFIAFMDGDDFVEPGYYEQLLSIAISHRPDVVIGAYTEWDDSGVISVESNKVMPGLYADEYWNREKCKMLFSSEDFYTPRFFTFLWNKIFRTEFVAPFVLEVPIKIRMGEDAAVTIPALYMARSVFVSEASGYFYVQHNASMMKKNVDGIEELENIRLLWSHFLTYNRYLEKYLVHFEYDIRQYLASLFYVRAFMNFANTSHIFWPFFLQDCDSKLAIVGKGNYFECLRSYAHFLPTSRQAVIFSEFNGANLDLILLTLKDNDRIILANINPFARRKIKGILIANNVSSSIIVEPNFELVKDAMETLEAEILLSR